MKILAISLLTFGLLNALLVATIMYWWIFTNDAPPFVNGRPIEVAAFVPGVAATFSTMFGCFIWSDAR